MRILLQQLLKIVAIKKLKSKVVLTGTKQHQHPVIYRGDKSTIYDSVTYVASVVTPQLLSFIDMRM